MLAKQGSSDDAMGKPKTGGEVKECEEAQEGRIGRVGGGMRRRGGRGGRGGRTAARKSSRRRLWLAEHPDRGEAHPSREEEVAVRGARTSGSWAPESVGSSGSCVEA